MGTPQEQRKIRLKNDYAEMQNIKGNIVQWKPIKGKAPHIEAYELLVKIRTITGAQPNYRDEHTIYLELPDDYPRVPPQINMPMPPPPFHPNWYSNGNWCYGTWDISEGLGHHVIRMIRTLQFDPDITNPDSPANEEANEWYLAQQCENLFPCDDTNLPDPTKRRFTIQPKVTKRFDIQS